MTDSRHAAHEVSPGLWQGGEWSFVGGCRCVVACAHGSVPYPGAAVVHRYQFRDALSPAEILRAISAAQCVVRNWERGDVLVTCITGLNRSGLVVGLALRIEGYTPQEAIELVRAARGPDALRNPAFVRLVRKLPDTMLHEEDK